VIQAMVHRPGRLELQPQGTQSHRCPAPGLLRWGNPSGGFMAARFIYHLVPKAQWRQCCAGGYYRPARFADDGFIHCCGEAGRLELLADDYFSEVAGDLLVLTIDVNRLESELRFEAPAPIGGGGTAHLAAGGLFPHLYGPLNLDAVVATRVMPRIGGRFRLPPPGPAPPEGRNGGSP